MDWPWLQRVALGTFAAALAVCMAILVVGGLIVGFAHVLTFVADRT